MRKLSFGFTMLFVLALVLGASAPAGAPAEQAAAPADNAAAAPAAAEATAEPTPVVNAFGQCDNPIRLWHGLTGSDGAVFAEMLQMYAEANPDVCFESQGIPWDLFFQKYPTACGGRHAPGSGDLPCRRGATDGGGRLDAADGRLL